MKKILLIIILLLFNTNVYALEVKSSVELVKCDSVSNIWISDNNETKRIHLLAFETTDGSLNNEINKYICSKLETSKLEIEYDSTIKDKYNRDLVYIYVDDKLLEEDLIEKGYGQVDNITTTLKYTEKLCDVQKTAIKNKVGIWKYPNIKEKYCNSGETIQNENEEQSNIKKNSNTNVTGIKYIIMINSGILVLLLLMKKEF